MPIRVYCTLLFAVLISGCVLANERSASRYEVMLHDIGAESFTTAEARKRFGELVVGHGPYLVWEDTSSPGHELWFWLSPDSVSNGADWLQASNRIVLVTAYREVEPEIISIVWPPEIRKRDPRTMIDQIYGKGNNGS